MADTLTRGYGQLEAYFGAEEGLSLKADNNQFLSSILRDVYHIEAAKKTKDEWCKFLVEKLDNGKVRLRDIRDVYLSRIYRDGKQDIEAGKPIPDICCEFVVYTRNGNVVFQADNGLFLSRITRGNIENLEAAKKDADQCCEFVPDIGDLKAPVFEITGFEDDGHSLTKNRVVLKKKEYINVTSQEQKHTFKMTWGKQVTDITTWKNAWGLNTKTSATINCFEDFSPVTISYDGANGKISSKEKLISEAEEVTVTVPPRESITAQFVVTMDDKAEIPFTATIKKTKVNGEVVQLTETGTWKGVVYSNVDVEFGKHSSEEA